MRSATKPSPLNKRQIIAENERQYLFRETTLRIALGIFVVMAIASSAISWSSQAILKDLYQQALTLIPRDKPVPSYPVSSSSALIILKNMIIYVVLIGSLLAIILGNIMGTRDKKAKALRVLFSKAITTPQYFWAKVTALTQVLGLIMGFAFLTSLISLVIVAGGFQLNWLLSMLAFYALALLFMLSFGLLALAFGFAETNSTQALLKPIALWVIMIFALPELGSALYPTGSLNPILPPTKLLQSPILASIHKLVYPFSISEHYKSLSSSLIGLTNVSALGSLSYPAALQILLIFAWVGIMLGFAYLSVKRLDVSRDDYA